SAVLVTAPARHATIGDRGNHTAGIQKPAPTKAKIALKTTATRAVLGTIEIADGVKEALVLQHLLRESPLWFHFLVPAPPLIMHHEAEWCRMSCSGQVFAGFAARSRSFHLVAAAI